MAAPGEEIRPRPPAGPRPRGKKEKDKDAGSSPRVKEPRERRSSRERDDAAGGEAEKTSKKQGRNSHRRSKDINWRHQFHQFLASSNATAFTQASRGTLLLQFTPLSGEDVQLIASALSANIPLRCFGLSNCQVSDDQCRKILSSASNNTHLRRIDLSWNPITEAAASAILEFMSNRPQTEELVLLGTGTTHETQMRVWNMASERSSKDGAAELPASPKPHLNTTQLNELVAKYHDTPANLEQALKHMKLQEDEVKYIVITIAERLWASSKLEKVLEMLLIGHRINSVDLGILFRLCKIYWDLASAQPKAARDMYYSVGLAFAERALLLDDKHVHQGFQKWQRDFTAALASSSSSATENLSPPATPLKRGATSFEISPRTDSNRSLAASAVLHTKKDKKEREKERSQQSASYGELPRIERRRSHTMDGGQIVGSSFKDLLKSSGKISIEGSGAMSPKRVPSFTELKAENEELRTQMGILYDELSKVKKREEKSARDSPNASAPTSPHGHRQDEDLEHRTAVQIAQLSALHVQLQGMTAKLESTRKQVAAMKDEERALQESIGRLSKKEQKIEAKKAKQQGIIGKAFVKLDLKQIVINEALSRGRGGSGATVHACTVDGWSCACKELEIADIFAADAEEGFMQEVSLLEKLPHHPNIVKYLFHEKKGQRIRLFMTRYHSNLTDYMGTRSVPFTPAAIGRYALSVLAGLEFLHKHQVLHRDLKSDNIFVMLDEKKEICQLAIGDFDVAKRLKVEQCNAKAVVGTPYIMAPEVLLRQQYSYPSDVFSYGMVLFELMAMKRPYEGRLFDVPELIIGAVPPDLPATVLSDASYTNLVRVHRACLRKEAERPSIDEVRSMLSSG